MEIWVIASVAAALVQTVRFALQKGLTGRGLGPAAATYARFAFSAPAILVAALAVAASRGVPQMSGAFWLWVVLGGAHVVAVGLGPVDLEVPLDRLRNIVDEIP